MIFAMSSLVKEILERPSFGFLRESVGRLRVLLYFWKYNFLALILKKIHKKKAFLIFSQKKAFLQPKLEKLKKFNRRKISYIS